MANPTRTCAVVTLDETSTDIRFQQRMWVAERCGWGLTVMVLLAAMAGAFGRGHQARGTVVDEAGDLRVSHETILRSGAPGKLRIILSRHDRPRVTLSFPRTYFEASAWRRITPPPTNVRASASEITLEFQQPPGGNEHEVLLESAATGSGPLQGAVTTGQGSRLTWSHFVLP
jgi:hypothetical protein